MTRHAHHPPEPMTVMGTGGLKGSAAQPAAVRRRHRPAPTPSLPHPADERVLMKGNEAMAEAAIQAGCDAYFGYPITPQAELLEWMARRMPEEGRAFVQAESEIAAINMALGAAAAGARVLVSSSSPGISLMGEAMSYMAAQELPMVLINVMRGGPGLGSIQPSQADYFQAVKGHGHGDYRLPVLAPGRIPEAIELVATSFELAERYRTPVMLLTDGIMGQAMEPVEQRFRRPPKPDWDWIVEGADGRPPRVVKSLHLHADDLERHNRHLAAKVAELAASEVRWAGDGLDDAELVVVAYGTAARIARTAVDRAREAGAKVGLFRPITLFPFPTQELRRLATHVKGFLVVELSMGQMVEDVQLAVLGAAPVAFFGRTGGSVPAPSEVLGAIERLARATDVAADLDWGADPVGLIEAPEERFIVVDEQEADPDPFSLIDEGARWALEHEVVR
ncbi:MAG: 3-methyl-2-oxobutanoate dehydrogenase subunit VorB [Chloroflexota bacterium]